MISFIKNKKYSKFIIKSDNASWVLDEIKNELEKILKNHFTIINQKFSKFFFNQCIFFLNKYDLLKANFSQNKIGVSIFHFDKQEKEKNYKIIKLLKNKNFITSIQVTNDKIKNFLIKSGINKNKIHKIPIGIELKKFKYRSLSQRLKNKKKLNLNKCLVIGSFQKDGIGWGDGMEPKKIKGPDIFIKIIKELSKRKKIHVILSGPSRGYIKRNLKRLNISFSHYYYKNYDDVIKLYSLIDVYIVSSRVEGGPRAILESMASGVVVFSTRVGQAEEIIKNNKNGYLYNKDDIKLVSEKIINVFNDIKKRKKIIEEGKFTSVKFSYPQTKQKWLNFFNSINS